MIPTAAWWLIAGLFVLGGGLGLGALAFVFVRGWWIARHAGRSV